MRTIPLLFDIMSIKNRTLCTYLFFLLFLFQSASANNSEAALMDPATILLQFETNQGCGDLYCATIQIKVKEAGETLQIGTSSIFVEYNAGALDFASYTSIHFDEEDVACVSDLFSPWQVQGVDGDEPGKVNIVMTLSENLKDYSCPIINSDEWLDVGVICFTVLNNNMPANITFSQDPARTNFNINDPNDGSITVPVDYDNLGSVTESPQNDISAPIIGNSSTTYELCAPGTGQPSSITLGLNTPLPNGFVPIWQRDGVDLPIYNTIDVEVSDFSFNPPTFVIYTGDTVRWTNVQGNHNINGTQAAFPANPVSFTNGPAASGNWTFDQAFNTAGVFYYQSDPDVNVNMTGSMSVYQNTFLNRVVYEPGVYTVYLRSLNDPSCTSEISNGLVITERDCTTNPEPTCPSVNIINDEQFHCDGEFNGAGLVLNWQTGIEIGNDPSNTAGNIIVSGSPVGSAGFPTAQSSGTYAGDGCNIDVQSFYAAVECDLDDDGVVDSYVAAGEFILNIFPTPQAPTIVPSYNATSQTCGFYFTATCPNDSLVYDITTLTTVACGDDNLSNVSVDVYNGNDCFGSFTVGRTNCQECDGGGCQPVTSNESASDAACTGTVVNLNSYLTNTPGSFTWSLDGNAISNPSNYELTATGCTNNTFVVNGYYTENVTGCVDEYFIEVSFTVYPEITATVDETSCNVTLNGACANYDVIWTDNLGSSGTGTSYTAEFSESGNVAFIVTNPDATGACSSKQFQGVFDCINCPTEVVETYPRVPPICADEEINLNNYSPENVLIEWFDVDGNKVTNDLVTFENNTCDFDSASFDGLYQTNEGTCVIDHIIHLDLGIYPNQKPTATTNGCAVSLENVCDIYTVSWIDSQGNTGTGSNYIADSGTTGTVNFRLLNEDGQCNVYETGESYNCAVTTCEIDSTLAMKVVKVCQGSNINLNDYCETPQGVNAVWEQELADGTLEEINPNNIIAQTESCSVGTTNYYINYVDNVNGCEISFSQKVKLRTYPEITAQIVSADCTVSLNQVCANYDVQWEDNAGNTGAGTTYTGTAGNEGNVSFVVTFANGIEECNTEQFVVAYACDSPCTETVVLDPLNTDICSEQVINLYDYFEIPANTEFDLAFGNGEVINTPTAFTIRATNCNGSNRNVVLVYTKQENDCEITYSQKLLIHIHPEISATISSNECAVELTDYCAGFNVTWSDDLGNSGSGSVYNAPDNSAGTVQFTLENPDALPACQSATFEADFECNLCFPFGGSFFETVSVCSNGILHLDSFLPDGINASWTDQNGIAVEMSSLEFYTQECDGSVFTYYAEYFSQDGTCTVNYDKTIEVTVYPELDIDIVNVACAVEMKLACPNFEMSWEDSFGNAGTDKNYFAADGTTGNITVKVSNPTAPINCDIEKTILFDCPGNNASEIDLEVSVTIDNIQGEYNIGDNVNFVIGVKNTSSVNATNIVVLNLLPEGIGYDGHLPSSGGYSPSNGYWNIPELSANSVATLIVQGILTEDGNVKNTAEVMSVDQNDGDSTPGNNNTTEDDYGSVSLKIVPATVDCIPNDCGDKNYKCIEATTLTEICVEFCGLTMPCDVTSAISENGSPTLINQGCFLIDPSNAAIANGLEIIALEGEDLEGNCAVMNLHIPIGNCGPAIEAEDDFYYVSSSENTMLNVIENDNGGEINVCEILEAPEKGTVEITSNGISYTPNSNVTGTDYLVYEICDEFGGISSASVYLVFSQAVACEIEDIQACTNNISPIVLCINFCGNNMEVENINASFGSNVQMLTNRCFKYTPKPNSSGEEHISIEGCNFAGECETVHAYIELSDNCDGNRLADPSINLFDNIEECEILIPTVITPNNDGVNDLLESKALYDCYRNMQFEFCIFNRHGQIVHELDQEEFNGILWNQNMDLMSEGVYYYALTITDGVNRKSQAGYIELRK